MPNAADARWQRLPKVRRAAVYRAIGRAARIAREARDAELAEDLRTIMNVLRAHAVARGSSRAKSTRTTPKRRSRAKR